MAPCLATQQAKNPVLKVHHFPGHLPSFTAAPRLRIWRLGVRIPRGAHNAPGQRPGADCFACLVIISVPRSEGSRSLLASNKRGNRWWVVVYAAREPLTGRKRQTRDREPAGPAG